MTGAIASRLAQFGARISCFESAEALALDASCRIVDQIRAAFRRRQRAALALAGGRTPFRVYQELSRWPLRWEWVDIVPTSERWVSRLSLERNGTLLRLRLLRGLAAKANYFPLIAPWETDPGHAELVGAAARADETVRKLGRLDLVLLGMGLDGHIASLFSDSRAARVALDPDAEQSCVLIPPGPPGPRQPRISLSLAEIQRARHVMVVIQGERKRKALELALDAENAPISALLRHRRRPIEVLWSP